MVYNTLKWVFQMKSSIKTIIIIEWKVCQWINECFLMNEKSFVSMKWQKNNINKFVSINISPDIDT